MDGGAVSEEQDVVRYEVDDEGVLVITLNRPERRNMWTAQMEFEFYAALDRAADDDAVRAIVVTGAGTSFVPGLDPAVLSAVAGGTRYATGRRSQTHATTIPKPIIGAINGACAGIGLAQALNFDLRFAVRGAKFSTAFAKRGLPAEDATAWGLIRLVGMARAFDLLVSARVFLAEEAFDLGLVQKLCEPGEVVAEAVTYARALAREVSPVAMAMMKSQVWTDSDSALDQARVRAQYLLTLAKQQPDFQEGVSSLVEKRPPRFAPYSRLEF